VFGSIRPNHVGHLVHRDTGPERDLDNCKFVIMFSRTGNSILMTLLYPILFHWW
jgi:hypothetical protein